MYFLLTYLFLPMIDAFIAVQIHQQSFYYPNSSCAFLRNASLPDDASIQSCIWECQYEHDCQTAVFDEDKKICSMYDEVCTTGRLESSGDVPSSVICHRKNHQPISSCSTTSTVSERTQEMISSTDVITTTTEETRTELTTTASRLTALNVNLVTNGDAETGTCETGHNVTHPTGWNYNGPITQVSYNVTGISGLAFTDPGPNNRGRCYFFGHNSLFTSMWQRINLTYSTDHLLIDNYTVKFNLSAWIGGFNGQNDDAIVSLVFINQLNQTVGHNVTIGPVLANDRGGHSSLLFRQANGTVPIGTRFLRIDVNIKRTTGPWNGGFVDNIAVILHQ